MLRFSLTTCESTSSRQIFQLQLTACSDPPTQSPKEEMRRKPKEHVINSSSDIVADMPNCHRLNKKINVHVLKTDDLLLCLGVGHYTKSCLNSTNSKISLKMYSALLSRFVDREVLVKISVCTVMRVLNTINFETGILLRGVQLLKANSSEDIQQLNKRNLHALSNVIFFLNLK